MGGRLDVVVDDDSRSGRSGHDRRVAGADDDDGEELVRLEDAVADDGNGERFRELAGLKDELAAGGRVVLSGGGVPSCVCQRTRLTMVDAADDVAVNVTLNAPLFPSGKATLPILTPGASGPPMSSSQDGSDTASQERGIVERGIDGVRELHFEGVGVFDEGVTDDGDGDENGIECRGATCMSSG